MIRSLKNVLVLMALGLCSSSFAIAETKQCNITVPCGENTPGCKTVCKCVSIPARGAIPAADIFVRISGEHKKGQPTLVFIHGFGGNAEDFQCQERGLCKYYRTVTLDLRGNFIRSTLTPPTGCDSAPNFDYTMDLFSDDVYAVLQELHITKHIVMIGHSMGAGVTINYATRHPEGLSKIVLVSGSPQFIIPDCAINPPCGTGCVCGTKVLNEFDLDISTCCTNCSACIPNCDSFCYPFGIQSTSSLGALGSCVEACYDYQEGCFSAECDETCPGCVANCIAPFILSGFADRCSNTAAQQILQTFLADEIFLTTEAFSNPFVASIQNNILNNALSENQVERLSHIHVPTLICYGNIDLLVDPRNSHFMHEQIEGSRLAEFANKSHNLIGTAYKSFNKLVRKFVKDDDLPKFKKIDGDCTACVLGTNFTTTACP